MGQQASLGEACSTLRPISWPKQGLTRNPQASYCRARYYDPTAGRFLNNDPLRFLAGINLYAYVRNNPTRFRDPSGKDPVIGVTVGLIAGTLQGGIGAALAGGNIKDIIIGAGVGGVIGAGIGAIDPSLGVGTLAIIGGASGGLGDLFGQIIAGAGTRCKPINWGSTLGLLRVGRSPVEAEPFWHKEPHDWHFRRALRLWQELL
jgi:RHS repeat-associated protein